MALPDGADPAGAMDKMYRYQRHIYDLSRKFYLLGRDRLIDELKPPPGGKVLEIGCGTGRNLIRAAKKYPEAQFFGFDISNEMLNTARQNVYRETCGKISKKITLAQADITSFDSRAVFGVAYFDRIYISYALSMIPPWREGLRHSLAFLSPSGSLHIIDFGDQAGLPGWFQTALRNWLSLFSVHPRLDLEDCLDALEKPENRQLDFVRLYRGYSFYAKLKASG